MEINVKYLFQIFFIAVILLNNFGNAIKCYQCTSVNDTRCENIRSDNSSIEILKECVGNYNGKEPFCRKTTQTILDEVRTVRVHRSCGWEEDKINPKPCYKYETDFHLEIICVCAIDGCNTAPHSTTPASVITIMATAGTILYTMLRR